MPLSAEERKTISKAKKSEKYAAPPAASSSASAVAAPEADDEEPVKAPAAASSSGSSLDDLRQRLQVCECLLPCHAPQSLSGISSLPFAGNHRRVSRA